jgi:hypothetical protein
MVLLLYISYLTYFISLPTCPYVLKLTTYDLQLTTYDFRLPTSDFRLPTTFFRRAFCYCINTFFRYSLCIEFQMLLLGLRCCSLVCIYIYFYKQIVTFFVTVLRNSLAIIEHDFVLSCYITYTRQVCFFFFPIYFRLFDHFGFFVQHFDTVEEVCFSTLPSVSELGGAFCLHRYPYLNLSDFTER